MCVILLNYLQSPHRLHLLRSKYQFLKIPAIAANRTSAAGSWLNAAIYYSDNFKEISSILDMLSQEDDAESIKQARKLMRNSSLQADFLYLKQNFAYVARAIAQLETNNELTLNATLRTIELAKAGIQATKNSVFINKFEQIINENIGLQELMAINKSSKSSKQPVATNEIMDMSLLYKFVPVVVANIEHLFYANNLLENRIKKIELKSLKRGKNENRINIGAAEKDHAHLWQTERADLSIKRESSPEESSNYEFPSIVKSEIDL